MCCSSTRANARHWYTQWSVIYNNISRYSLPLGSQQLVKHFPPLPAWSWTRCKLVFSDFLPSFVPNLSIYSSWAEIFICKSSRVHLVTSKWVVSSWHTEGQLRHRTDPYFHNCTLLDLISIVLICHMSEPPKSTLQYILKSPTANTVQHNFTWLGHSSGGNSSK